MNSCGSEAAPTTRDGNDQHQRSEAFRVTVQANPGDTPPGRGRLRANRQYTAGMDPGVGSIILLGIVAVLCIGSLLLVRQSRQLRSSDTAPRGSDNASSATPPTG